MFWPRFSPRNRRHAKCSRLPVSTTPPTKDRYLLHNSPAFQLYVMKMRVELAGIKVCVGQSLGHEGADLLRYLRPFSVQQLRQQLLAC